MLEIMLINEFMWTGILGKEENNVSLLWFEIMNEVIFLLFLTSINFILLSNFKRHEIKHPITWEYRYE